MRNEQWATLRCPRSTDKTILTADSADNADIGGPAVDVGRGEDYRRMVLNAGNRGRSHSIRVIRAIRG